MRQFKHMRPAMILILLIFCISCDNPIEIIENNVQYESNFKSVKDILIENSFSYDSTLYYKEIYFKLNHVLPDDFLDFKKDSIDENTNNLLSLILGESNHDQLIKYVRDEIQSEYQEKERLYQLTESGRIPLTLTNEARNYTYKNPNYIIEFELKYIKEQLDQKYENKINEFNNELLDSLSYYDLIDLISEKKGIELDQAAEEIQELINISRTSTGNNSLIENPFQARYVFTVEKHVKPNNPDGYPWSGLRVDRLLFINVSYPDNRIINNTYLDWRECISDKSKEEMMIDLISNDWVYGSRGLIKFFDDGRYSISISILNVGTVNGTWYIDCRGDISTYNNRSGNGNFEYDGNYIIAGSTIYERK